MRLDSLSRSPNPSTKDNLLSKYFGEVASLPVFEPREELEKAREIQWLEVELWSQILSHPSLLPALLGLIKVRIDNPLMGDFTALRGSARAFQVGPGKSTRKRFDVQRERVADRIRHLDLDRKVLDEVYETLWEIGRGETRRIGQQRIRIRPRSRTFEEYLDRITDLYRRSQRARNDFVKANLRLVVTIARRYYFGQVSFSDLVQEGNLGLIKAVGRYDHRRGYRFSTYAAWWIRHAITRGLSDRGRLVRVPVYLLGNRYKVKQAQQRLASQLGRLPTSDEICSCTGLEMDKVEQLQDFYPDVLLSLDSTIDSEGGQRYIDLLEDPGSPAPAEAAMSSEILAQVEQVLEHLMPIEADVVRERFGLADGNERSLAEVGRSHHLSRERIRQIQNVALDKIRRELGFRRAG